MGQLGLSPSEFYALTPAEFIYVWIAWCDRQTFITQQEWERTRWAVWNLFCAELKIKKPKPIKKMFPLPWDDVKQLHEKVQMSHEERIAQIAAVRESYNKTKR